MNINNPNVEYSPIVEIGEMISLLEKKNGDEYLKLHRGVMDVCTIDLSRIELDLNKKSIQQYGKNDGDPDLILSIKEKFGLDNHNIIITPGGMPSIDIVIDCLSDKKFWIPTYHWGSWTEILKMYKKDIYTFDDFNLDKFNPTDGVVMICYPSNPTGWMPDLNTLKNFISRCEKNNVTVLLDIPYYHLFFADSSDIKDSFSDNVIVLSSFSKSLGLSGLRVGYIATKSTELYNALRIKSLYKYNSISNIPQKIILDILNNDDVVQEYRTKTINHISTNIKYLVDNNLLFKDYPTNPIGPFAIVNMYYEDLLEYQISSVPLDKFMIRGAGRESTSPQSYLSRISLAVNSTEFAEYFNEVLTESNKTIYP